MRDRARNVVPVVLLAALGVYYAPARSPSARPAEAKTGEAQGPGGWVASPASTPGPKKETDFLGPWREFWNLADNQDPVANERASGHRTDFLVATVPDPIDSHVGHRFDSAIDSIQRALEAKAYTLDRYWFPWVVWRDQEAWPRPRPGATAAWRSRTAATAWPARGGCSAWPT
jgi:hypothetical protein